MITVYSTENCQQCKTAKLLLDMKGVDYVVKMLDVDFTREEVKSLAPNQRSFPVITKRETYGGVLMNEQLLGGLHQLQQILNGDSL